MVKVKVVCQECNEEHEIECRGVFVMAFDPPGEETVHCRTIGHHISNMEVMHSVTQWFLRQILPQGEQPAGEEPGKTQAEFLEFLKKLGLDLENQ